MRWIAAIASALVLALLSGGIWVWTRSGAEADPFEPCRSASVAGGMGQIGGPFELVNAEGRTVTDAEVITEPSLVYFGYTFCPDVCPLDAVRNADAVDLLAERGISATPVFISIDPARDTPEVMGDFAYNIHEKMVGLTGSPEQVQAASQAYRTYYKAHESDDDFYLVDHSTFTYLVLPGEGAVEFFRREIGAQEMADKAACFIDRM